MYTAYTRFRSFLSYVVWFTSHSHANLKCFTKKCAISTIKYAHLQNWYSMEWNIHTSSFSGTSGTAGFQTQLKRRNSILLVMQVFDAMLTSFQRKYGGVFQTKKRGYESAASIYPSSITYHEFNRLLYSYRYLYVRYH